MKTVVSTANKNTNNSTTNSASPSPSVSIIPKTEPNTNSSVAAAATAADTVATSSSTLQFQAPTGPATSASGGNKRPVSLDLKQLSASAKKQRLVAPSPLMVDSPDLQSIKTLNTPDLEKYLLSSNLLQTPQPGVVFPTKVGPVTSEQEAFGKGFEEALHSLHNSKNTQSQVGQLSGGSNNTTANGSNSNTAAAVGTSSTLPSAGVTVTTSASSTTAGAAMNGGTFTYTNLENSFPVAIKDEPQNPPASPPVSPIDMETQEKIKLERKRQRNRVAASKCRKRKLERISKLEDKVKILKCENTDLSMVVKNLKDHVAQLKQQVIEHFDSGCSIATMYNGNTLLLGK